MDQQEQALGYFRQNAAAWQSAAAGAEFSVIANRHNAVLEVMNAWSAPGRLLDVGCGTGQLAIEASKRGWRAVGIDYAAPMVDICQSNNREAGTDARFECVSLFDFDMPSSSYDVISAQGFIEYISLAELDTFFALVGRSLKSGGAAAIGSRNRLFNLHSLNEFSSLELQLGTVENLLREAIILQSSASQRDALQSLGEVDFEYSHPDVHPERGVKVERRFQFSPADLVGRLKKHGLKASRIFPVHFHALPLSLVRNDRLGELHNYLAELVSNSHTTAHTFVPYSSSFVIEARKD